MPQETMTYFWILVSLSILLVYNVNGGLGLQQRYNANTDFLLHEAGGNPTAPKRETSVSSSNQAHNNLNSKVPTSKNRDYESQFPALRGPGQTPQVTANPEVVLTRTTQSAWGKRNYVAPTKPTTIPSKGPILIPSPDQSSPSNVKQLINFYDNKTNKGPVTNVPSYSSVLRNPSVSDPNSRDTKVAPTSAQTRSTAGLLTSKASTPTTPKPGSVPVTSTANRPGNTVLPSSLAAGNKITNQASNQPTDIELTTLSEELLRRDTNNAFKYISVNYQEKTTSQSKEDKAPLPLLAVSDNAWNMSTVQKFGPLLDNYERDTLVNEYVTPQERKEENEFMDAIMSTSVIRHLMNFLKDKGYVTPDPKQQRDFLKQLWFTLYSRGKGKLGSSGFEHVFVSELKNGDVIGLHNWIYFAREESAGRLNYLGYLKYEVLGDKGVFIKLHFDQQGADKPVNSMFIGTSPELEIALYTLCFVTRADSDCKLSLGGKEVNIITHTFRYRSKNLIGSAYPQI